MIWQNNDEISKSPKRRKRIDDVKLLFVTAKPMISARHSLGL
jgi:hypothetical protein